MDRPDWAPEGIDVHRPSAARIYDYWLGGSHNFAIDREVAREVSALVADTALIMQVNRAFLHRAVRLLIGEGIRQFLDLGSGIPTLGNVHEVAQKASPDAKVVYVDIDPVAVAHSQHILGGNPNAAVIKEDLRNADAILSDPRVRALLDFDQPIAVLMMAVLHFIPHEDDAEAIVARYRDAIGPGSFLGLSHGTADAVQLTEEELSQGIGQMARTTTPVTTRTRAEVERLFSGLELVEPGVVWTAEWRPEHPDEVIERPERSTAYAGVGRKR
jgi:SAM-dependent methyltransferase